MRTFSNTRGDSYLNQSELLLERIDKDILRFCCTAHGLIVFIIFSQTHLIGKFDFESKSICKSHHSGLICHTFISANAGAWVYDDFHRKEVNGPAEQRRHEV